jgi:hypothetical protein
MRNIIFSAPMIRAIIAGTKTQTRRLIDGAPDRAGFADFAVPGNCGSGCTHTGHDGFALFFEGPTVFSRGLASLKCRYGKPGDRLWVRESWKPIERDDGTDGIIYAADDAFRAIEASEEAADRWVAAYDNGSYGDRWRSPIFMPRWCSRLEIKLEEVRVQRLADITEDDARAELGPQQRDPEGDCWTSRADIHRSLFEYAWCEMHGWNPNAWAANPWVWCLTFKRVERDKAS